MSVHIFVVPENNFKVCLQKGLAAIPSGSKADSNDQLISRMSLIRENDKLLFYLTGIKEIRGIFQVESAPFYDNTLVWDSDEGQCFPYRVRFRETETMFRTPILLSDIYDLRDTGKIWTFSLRRPGGTGNSVFSISNVEFEEILELYHKINHVVENKRPIAEPYRHIETNLPEYLNFNEQGGPKYESTLMALFFSKLSKNEFQDLLGSYSDYLAYVPTSFEKEIDAVLLYSSRNDRKKIMAYSIIELKLGLFDEKGLSQLLQYEDWFLKKRAGGDSRAIRTVAIASKFDNEVINYLSRRKRLEGKVVRLLRYSCFNRELSLAEIEY